MCVYADIDKSRSIRLTFSLEFAVKNLKQKVEQIDQTLCQHWMNCVFTRHIVKFKFGLSTKGCSPS